VADAGPPAEPANAPTSSPHPPDLPPAAAGQTCAPAGSGCITCGDVAVPLTVVGPADPGDARDAPDPGDAPNAPDARCRDADGRVETVATDLVGTVTPGDRLLVHAGVAIARLEER
jgi:hypothetical protein